MARPDEEVWVIAGDGGFQMTASELSTLVQEQLPLRIGVVNNGYLGMVRQWQELFCGKRYAATPMHGPDFCRLAEAHGIPALRVESRAQLAPSIASARRTAGPVLLEFKVEREDLVYPMVPPGANLEEMLRRPQPGPRRLAAASGSGA
jgi:acetolactate synthase-1/2/3 large subunit